jgi:hypothetical protein
VEKTYGGEKTPHLLMLYELRSNMKFLGKYAFSKHPAALSAILLEY